MFLDLSSPVCFSDLGGPVFWTSVVQCVFRPRWSGVFWTLVVQCVFGPWWSSAFFGPRWSIVFWTSVVNYVSAVLDLSQWSVHCWSRTSVVQHDYNCIGPLWSSYA